MPAALPSERRSPPVANTPAVDEPASTTRSPHGGEPFSAFRDPLIILLSGEARLRPIVMTSLAFIVGILPPTWATGAGGASRNSIGTAVFGGMPVSTVPNLLFVPVIYVVIASIRARFTRDVRATPANGTNGHAAGSAVAEVPAGPVRG